MSSLREIFLESLRPDSDTDRIRKRKQLLVSTPPLIAILVVLVFSPTFYTGLMELAIIQGAAATLLVVAMLMLLTNGYSVTLGNTIVTLQFLPLIASIILSGTPTYQLEFWLLVPPMYATFFIGLLSGGIWWLITLLSFSLLNVFLPSHTTSILNDDPLHLDQLASIMAFSAYMLLIFMLYELQRKRVLLKLTWTNEELMGQLEELKRSAITKDRILSTLSHNLRNPFHSINRMLLLSDSDNLTPEEESSLTEKLALSVNQSQGMLEDMLQWATTSHTSDITPERTELNLNEVAKKVTSSCALEASLKRIQFQIKLNDIAYADQNLTEIILRNFITNAIKFSHPGSTVIIDSVAHEEQVDIRVSDNGTGISDDIRGDLFYFIVTVDGTNQEKGSGLGLIMCREFAEKQGGKVFFDAQYRRGTRMCLRLPRYA